MTHNQPEIIRLPEARMTTEAGGPRYLPLSNSQINILRLETAYSGMPINNICCTMKIFGRVDVSLLKRAIALLYDEFPVLRTRITSREGETVQYISDIRPTSFPYYDFSSTGREGVYGWDISVAREYLPIEDSPLFFCAIFKASEGEGGVLIRCHHIISDAWSQVLICNALSRNYLALLAGEEATVKVSPDYSDHVRDEREYMSSPEHEEDRRYWREVLSDPSAPSRRPVDTAALSHIGRRKSFPVPEEINRLISEYCALKRISPFAVMYMALAIYSRRVLGQESLCAGVPIVNRRTFKDKNTAGMFVSTLPYICRVDDGQSFNEFNESMMGGWYELLRHQRLPYSEIRELAGPGGISFDVVLSFQNGQIYKQQDAEINVEGRWHYSGYQAEPLCIHLSSRERESNFLVDYDYLVQLYTLSEIEGMHGHMLGILENALKHPDTPIRELDIMYSAENEKVLFGFNSTRVKYDHPENLALGLIAAASAHGSRAAVIFGGERYKYGELMSEARSVAAGIRAALPGSGNVVAISMRRGARLIAALSGVLISGNAYLLIDTSLPPARRRELIEISGAALTISEGGGGDDSIEYASLAGSDATHFTLPDIGGEDIAYIVFTSGSTGAPKAVQVPHRAVLNFASAMRPLYGRSAVLSICAISFDAFVIESICSIINARTVVMASEAELNDPNALAGLMADYDAGFLSLTPSRLSSYIKNPRFAAALSRAERIICGGEAFPGDLYTQLRRLTGARIINQYGPSETTVGVSYLQLSGPDDITIGRPMPNCYMYVLDDTLRPLPVGAAGEIYIGGACLSKGYRGDAALTAEKFIPDPFRPGSLIYKTGDLGRWSEGGEITYLGRADSQIKLNGHRIEPYEIEARLRECPGVDQAAVKVVGGNLLAAFYTCESGREVSPDHLRRQAAMSLPRYMVPGVLVMLDELPFTRNGKIDYQALTLPGLDTGADAEPAGETERALTAAWRAVLKNQSLGAESDFFISGGDSLTAIELLAEIEERLGLSVSLGELQLSGTPRALAAAIDAGSGGSAHASIPRGPELDSYPLSPSQLTFFVHSAAEPDSILYNMPGAFRPSGRIDTERLERALNRYIEIDELMRTGFELTEGGAQQKIYPSAHIDLELIGEPDWRDAYRQFARPFDISRPPLMRAAINTAPGGEQTLLIDTHHIISDAISSELMLRRIAALYSGLPCDRAEIRYVDYVRWQAARADEARAARREFWRGQVAGLPPRLEIEPDYPSARPEDLTRGERVTLSMGRELAERLDEYCRGNNVTPFMLMLAAYSVTLAAYSGSRDFFIGVPASGRGLKELSRLTGPFISTLPVRIAPRPTSKFAGFLSDVKNSVLAALDNQDLPMEEIIALSGAARQPGRNPLYSAMFSLRPIDASSFTLGENIRLAPLDADSGTAKVELSLEAAKADEGYTFTLEYASALYTRDTIALIGRGFVRALGGIIENREATVADIPVISEYDAANTITSQYVNREIYDGRPIDMIIDDVAAANPSAPAIEWGADGHMTYSELKRYSDGFAARLIENGARPGDFIALLARRDGGLLPAMLGILKAGCAYLPLDSAYPPDRIKYMLDDADAKILVVSKGIEPPSGVGDRRVVTISLDDGVHLIPPAGRGSRDVMYALYTSGSTGQPKGVLVHHQAMSNLASDARRLLSYNGARSLCTANVIFDIFATETWLPLSLGKCVVMADEEEMLLPWRMAERMTASRANALQLTPSRMQMCLGDESFRRALGQMQIVMLIGEPWGMSMLDAIRGCGARRVVNLYGPTEATVHAGWSDLTDSKTMHFGRPLPNCRFYAMDAEGHVLPPTARGELYIAGDCVALGYLNKPELTAAAFLPDPLFPNDMMYKTGDMVRQRADGNWVYLGRRDRQIKLNGHRVEPDEISDAILASGRAREAALTLEQHDGNYTAVHAYVVPDASYDEAALRAELAAKLPDYMMPSTISTLTDLPRTANGKTDVLALSKLNTGAPESAASAGVAPQPPPAAAPIAAPPPAPEPPAPQGEIIDRLAGIWADCLKHESVDTTKSFFEQGGSSLSALAVLSKYYAAGISMSLADFYKHPTIAAQAAFLGPVAPAHTEPAKVTHAEPAAPARARDTAAPTLPRFIPGGYEIMENGGGCLLTGATGFLGAHLADALTLSGDESELTCLARGGYPAVKEAFEFYFKPKKARKLLDKVSVVKGDITADRLGLSGAAYERLAESTGAVYHAAADVRHYASDDSLNDVNVGGTGRVIELAKASGAALYHISTMSVSGEFIEGNPELRAVFTERDLNMGQNLAANAYVLSKARAEALVAEAMDGGLQAQIHRVGRLVGRRSDGVFQRNPESNAFFRVVAGLISLGAIPESLKSELIEMTPVDMCARAIVKLRGGYTGAYHIINPRMVEIGRLLALKAVPDSEFMRRLRRRLEAGPGDDYINAVAEMFLSGDTHLFTVRIDSAYTSAALSAAGGSFEKYAPQSVSDFLPLQ